MPIFCVESHRLITNWLYDVFLYWRVNYVCCLTQYFYQSCLHLSIIYQILYIEPNCINFRVRQAMARIELNIRFFYEDVLYADTLGYIPRHEAIKIPELKIEEREQKPIRAQPVVQAQVKQANKNKKEIQMQEQFDPQPEIDENQDIEMEAEDGEGEGENQNEGEIENYGEADDLQEDEQPELDDMADQNQEIQYENQIDNENQNQQGEEDDQQIDQSNDDLSEFSRSPNLNYAKYKTKRQKGQLDKFLQLPLKKPRKDAKKFDEATQLIRKQQKQRKRRQYIKKMNEAQQKATFDKILNETGRKFRQREQKEMKEVKQKDAKIFKTLGNVPKIVTKQTAAGMKIQLNRTPLFKPQVFYEPNVRMSEPCIVCHQVIGKYKTKNGQKFCSVACFKKIQQKQREQSLVTPMGKVC